MQIRGQNQRLGSMSRATWSSTHVDNHTHMDMDMDMDTTPRRHPGLPCPFEHDPPKLRSTSDKHGENHVETRSTTWIKRTSTHPSSEDHLDVTCVVSCRAKERRKRRCSMKMPSLLEISRRTVKEAVGSTGSTVSLERWHDPHTSSVESIPFGSELQRRDHPGNEPQGNTEVCSFFYARRSLQSLSPNEDEMRRSRRPPLQAVPCDRRRLCHGETTKGD
jgi:hypothetical protein